MTTVTSFISMPPSATKFGSISPDQTDLLKRVLPKMDLKNPAHRLTVYYAPDIFATPQSHRFVDGQAVELYGMAEIEPLTVIAASKPLKPGSSYVFPKRINFETFSQDFTLNNPEDLNHLAKQLNVTA
jgi:hypothetical protein